MVQWLRLHASNAGGASSIPGRGTKIPHATWRSQKIRKKKKKDCLLGYNPQVGKNKMYTREHTK